MIAILDANVLYPAFMRDILLTLAEAELFQPKWTVTIQEEWTRNLLANRPQITQSSITHTINAMNEAFPDAEIKNYLPLIDNLTLPDPDDFISEIIQTRLTTSYLAFEKMITRFKSPPLSHEHVLNMLEKCGLPESAKLLSLIPPK